MDIVNALNVHCNPYPLTFWAARHHVIAHAGFKEDDNIETFCEELRNMFQYFKAMRVIESRLRYFDYLGYVPGAEGKTDGQQGDGLEKIAFCLSIHHLWGRTLEKHQQDACAVAYADDGHIKTKLSVALEVLLDRRDVLRKDAGLDLNFGKTQILVKGISAADEYAAVQRMLAADPSVLHLSLLLSPAFSKVDGGEIRVLVFPPALML